MEIEKSATKDKIDALKGKYQAIMFVLDSVVQRLGMQPDQLIYNKPEFQDYLLGWQKEMVMDLNKLRELIMKQEEKLVPQTKVEEEEEEEEAAEGKASDYLVAIDPKKSSTWHLRVKRNGKYDKDLLRAAKAALLSNFRGQPYKGPNKAEAISKLKAIYKKLGIEW